MVKELAVPGQPFAVGVTVIVAVTGTLLVFVAAKAAILPVPDVSSPIEGVVLIQL